MPPEVDVAQLHQRVQCAIMLAEALIEAIEELNPRSPLPNTEVGFFCRIYSVGRMSDKEGGVGRDETD